MKRGKTDQSLTSAGGWLCDTQVLLTCLRERAAAWSSRQVIGDIFCALAGRFRKTYLAYQSNLGSMLETFGSALSTTPALRRFVARVQTSGQSVGRSLDQLLAEPRRRVGEMAACLATLVE